MIGSSVLAKWWSDGWGRGRLNDLRRLSLDNGIGSLGRRLGGGGRAGLRTGLRAGISRLSTLYEGELRAKTDAPARNRTRLTARLAALGRIRPLTRGA